MSTYHLHTSNTEILFSLYPSLRKSLQDVNFMDNDHVTNGSNPIKSVSIFSPFSVPPIKTEVEAGVVVFELDQVVDVGLDVGFSVGVGVGVIDGRRLSVVIVGSSLRRFSIEISGFLGRFNTALSVYGPVL